MKRTGNKERYMPSKAVDVILIALPIIGMLLKNLFYLGFLLGDNYYQMNLGNAFSSGGKFIFMQLAVMALLIAPSVFCKGKGKYIYLVVANVFFSVLAFIDICYARFFNDLPSISMLGIVSFTNDSVASSGNAMLPVIWTDLLFLLDVIVWVIIYVGAYIVDKKTDMPKKTVGYSIKARGIAFGTTAIICVLALVVLPIMNATGSSNDLYAEAYDTHGSREKSVAFTPFGYHMWDIGDSIIPKKITNEKQALIDGYYEWNNADYFIDENYYGRMEGKNVVMLQLESFETFLIGNSVEGQELTPNLNALLSQSLFFDNIYDQVACGNSSDCDFMINTSLYPSSGVSAYNFFSENTYNSTEMILSQNGYKTSYFNSLKNSFWNYYPMNKDGMKFDVNDYEFELNDKIYQYISDESYLSQLADKIITLQAENDAPIYSHTTTDSSHGPFRLPEERLTLNLSEKYQGNVLGDYLQAVHYADGALGQFLEKMSDSPEYRNTIFVFIGDHRGIHKYYPQEINKYSDEELPSFIDRNFNAGVPMIIFDPSMEEGKGETISTYGGQTDLAPTLMYLLGIDREYYMNTYMGRSLLGTTRNCTYSSDGILRGDYSETDEYWMKLAYYLSDFMLETDYFNK